MNLMGGLQKKMQQALFEQAYLSYKYGWHQATVLKKAKLSKKEFADKIKTIIEEGRKIADGYNGDDLFPEGTDEPIKTNEM